MRFLIVVQEFPPARSPRAYRWGAIAEEFARHGHRVDVVCSWKPGLERRESGPVTIHRVGSWLGARLRQKFARSGTVNGSQTGQPDAPGGVRAAALLSKLASIAYYRAWKPLYWPDAQCLFVLPALRAARRLLRRHQYDALFTVSLPFCCHLVGLALKRSRPGLPWIVDVGDPFALLHDIPLNNHRLYGRLNRRAEGAVLARADRVAMTTPGALEDYRRAFDFDADKTSIIPPLLSLPGSPAVSTVAPPGRVPDKAIKMVYCGRLYNDIRSPAYLLRLWRRLAENPALGSSLELHFYGDLGDCRKVFEPYRDAFDKQLFLHGEVERTAVARALAEADVLVNIGNSTSHQLPSKIVEYIGMGKPILNLVSHGRDCTLDVLADHPATLNLRCDTDSLETNAARTAEFAARLPIVISAEKLAKMQAPYLPRTIADSYLELVQRPRDSSAKGSAARTRAAADRPQRGSLEKAA